MFVKRTRANQITIPKRIMQDFEGTDYFEVTEKRGVIVLEPLRIKSEKSVFSQVRAKIKRLGITEKDIEEAIRSVRGAGD